MHIPHGLYRTDIIIYPQILYFKICLKLIHGLRHGMIHLTVFKIFRFESKGLTPDL